MKVCIYMVMADFVKIWLLLSAVFPAFVWYAPEFSFSLRRMQYKEGELSKEAYIEMKDDRNSWKEFCEERKKSLEQTIRKLEKQQKEEARFLRSLLELDGTTRINAELAEGLIESMYLYGDGKLEINFGFKGAVEHE